MNKLFQIVLVTLLLSPCVSIAQKIDRKALVTRHNVEINKVNILGSLTVGNGKFAFTVDATGLQSFPEYYAKGIPLGTESEWGWHTFPNNHNYQYSEVLKEYNFNGDNPGKYAVQGSGRNLEAAGYFRGNPHRLQLGNIGLLITKKDGALVTPEDLQNIRQQLNVWTGEITSNFDIEGTPVKVMTCAHADQDIIAVKITSPLIKQQRIKIRFRFPDPGSDRGINYAKPSIHQTELSQPTTNTALFSRKLDSEKYFVEAGWNGKAEIAKTADHDYTLLPSTDEDSFEVSTAFSLSQLSWPPPSFLNVDNSSIAGWKKFWLSGAAVDLSGSTDSRAFELERRIILSQYLLRAQEAGNNPPQETGLTYNSWSGRPHMEMIWWHMAHYALWGRAGLLENSMQWYFKAFDGAKAIAERQEYKGIRWQKMTDNEGGESPSNIGSFLIWQQPHPIYMAELLYRDKPSKALLEKYQPIVFATADFMASFASYDKEKDRYNLGKGIIPAQESYKPAETFNAPYELAYWKWALQVAQQWRLRLGMQPDKNWQAVIDKIAPLPKKDDVYIGAESVDDAYSPKSSYIIDHPAVLMASALLPPNGMVDAPTMRNTFDTIKKVWHWDHTWGWDYPTVAMAATRLNMPDEAIDALFREAPANRWLVNGHNYQSSNLTLYMPGNGGLLLAIAMMCAGTDGDKTINPGFPKNGKWKVKWEGLKPLP